MRIAFVHPVLGLGGAERLVLDAAEVLAERGHEVTLFTAACDRERAFDELVRPEIDVRVCPPWLPSSLGGRLKAPLAIARTGQLVAHAARSAPELLFVDLVPHVIPLARKLTRAKVVYYCHFPDLLLTPHESRRKRAYRWYRRPLDRAEGAGLARADLLLANSRFTAGMVRATFPALRAPLAVVSPGVDVSAYAPVRAAAAGDELLLLSIARYDPRKNLVLAVDALAALRARLSPSTFARVRLLLAGDLSADTPGSEATYRALAARVAAHGLTDRVELWTSITDREKQALLRRARLLVYTSPCEHFGIVPLEAMAAGTPVVAVAAGGPEETVLDGRTGFLCAPEPEAFAERMAQLLEQPELARRLGAEAVAHVARHHSRQAFAERLEAALVSSLKPGSAAC